MSSIVRWLAIFALLLLFLGAYLGYVYHYEVRPTVFSANGWGKKLEFNVSSPGYYEFDVPVLPGMRAGGSDLVLVDSNGNVLEFYAWSGHKIPYRRVYEVNYSIDSPVFTYVPFLFPAEGGAGVYDSSFNPILFSVQPGAVVPFFGLSTYYIGDLGSPSPYGLDLGDFLISPDDLNGKLLFPRTVSADLISSGDEYWTGYRAGSFSYLFYLNYGSYRDYWTLYRCDIYLRNCTRIANGALFPDSSVVLPIGDKLYIFTSGNPFEMSNYCSASARRDPNNFGCWNGLRLGYFDSSGRFHVVWYRTLWEQDYLWLWGTYYPFKDRYYFISHAENWYGPDPGWSERPFFYFVSLDPATGEFYVVKKYYYDQFIDIKEPYPRRYVLAQTLVPSENGLYLFIRYVSTTGNYKKAVLVFDPETLEFKYKANAQFLPIYKAVINTTTYDGVSFFPKMLYYSVADFYPGYSINVDPRTGRWIVLGLRNDKTHAVNPSLYLIPYEGNYIPLYVGWYMTSDYWPEAQMAVGYIDPSGNFHDIFPADGCCRSPHFTAYVDPDTGEVFVYVFRNVDGLRGTVVIRPGDLEPFRGELFNISLSYQLLEPSEENVIHVRAYFPAPGTYYLYYDSDSSWYHLYPQADSYTRTEFNFSEPMSVQIRPHFYSLNVEGNGEYYTVYLELNDDSGPVYSQCFWNGTQMTQVAPGYHVLTAPGASPVEYNLDCFALEVAELHKSSVLFFPEEGDLNASLIVSPDVVMRGQTVTLSYTGDNPACYLVQGDWYARVTYPEFNADFPAGTYEVWCDSPGYEPASASLTIEEEEQRPPTGGGAAFAPPARPPVTGAEPVVTQPPVQPASPLPLGANIWIILIVALLILYFLILRG